jgi:hypothetical protein
VKFPSRPPASVPTRGPMIRVLIIDLMTLERCNLESRRRSSKCKRRVTT